MDLLVFAHAQKVVSIEKNPSDNTFQIISQFNTADSSWCPPVYQFKPFVKNLKLGETNLFFNFYS